MDGEGGAFLIFMGIFSQDSHGFSQRWEKMRDFLGKITPKKAKNSRMMLLF